MNPELILKEGRRITSLLIDSSQPAHTWHPISGANACVVGNDGVTRIEAYNEFGESDYVIWFAIYTDEEITWRVNGKYVVEVGYAR